MNVRVVGAALFVVHADAAEVGGGLWLGFLAEAVEDGHFDCGEWERVAVSRVAAGVGGMNLIWEQKYGVTG